MRPFRRRKPIVPRLPEPKLVQPSEVLEEEKKRCGVTSNGYGFFRVRGKSGTEYTLGKGGYCISYCISTKGGGAGPVSALAIMALIQANEPLFRRVANHTGWET